MRVLAAKNTGNPAGGIFPSLERGKQSVRLSAVRIPNPKGSLRAVALSPTFQKMEAGNRKSTSTLE